MDITEMMNIWKFMNERAIIRIRLSYKTGCSYDKLKGVTVMDCHSLDRFQIGGDVQFEPQGYSVVLS